MLYMLLTQKQACVEKQNKPNVNVFKFLIVAHNQCANFRSNDQKAEGH